MLEPTRSMVIDVVDAADRPTGITIRRDEVLDRHVGFRTVHVFIFNREGELLLQRLSPKRDRHPEQWGSSVAGYLFAGEDYPAAAERRVEQELGIHPRLTPVGKTTMQDVEATKHIALFTATWDGPFRILPDHIAEERFFPLWQIEQDIQTGARQFTPTFLHLFGFYRSLAPR